jgi:hypothetical protein
MTGVTSSREAATATCEMASENASPGTTPDRSPTVGSAQEREVGRAAADRDAVLVGGERDGSVGEAVGDVGEETTADEDRAGLVDLGRDGGLGRDLVVERREREAVGVGLDQHSAEDRQGGALRQELHGEGDGIAEDVAVDLELHAGTPVRLLARGWPANTATAQRRAVPGLRAPAGCPQGCLPINFL